MKIIAVHKKVPFTLRRKDSTNLIGIKKLEGLLKTPQFNKASSIKPVFDEITPVESVKEVEVKHNPISSMLLRDMKDIVYLGTLEGVEILKNETKDKILKILQKDYKNNSFYPISIEECRFGKLMENLCYNKNWDDVLLKNNEEYYYQSLEYNKALAEEILGIYKFGDIIWITDPLHFSLPKILREKISDIKIAVSFLLPFPSFDKFSCFSHPVEIIESLLQASYIDFQCKNDLTNFVDFAKINTKCSYKNRTIKHKREVNLSINPIALKEDLPKKVLASDLAKNCINELKCLHKNKKIVVSVSKLDSNHLISIYKSINYFLKHFNTDVIFVNLELSIGEYNTEEKAEISRIEDYLRFNGYDENFKRLCVPDYKYYAYLSLADVCVVLDDHIPAIRDFTFINRNKPLIVNKMIRLEKNNFIKVNPKNEIKLANKINDALKSEGNTNYNIEIFNSSVSKFISKIKKGVKKKLTLEKVIPENKLDLIKEKYSSAKKCAFIFDYDGTLTKIVDKPENAFPSDVVKIFLKDLSEKNKVIISTGRDKATVDKWFPKELEVYAEHGSLHRFKGDWSYLSEVHGWKEYAREVINYYVERSPGSLLEEKETSLAFHYRNCDETIQNKQAQACVASLLTTFKDFKQLEVHEGKCVVEIKPSGKNKGDLIKLILEEEDYDFIFCAGDDVTDEDMFIEGRLKDVFHSVLVGNRESYAKYKVNTPEDLINFVKELVK